MPKNTAPLPDWELVLSSAARLQRILPDAVLAELESVAGWKTARVQRPVQILGSLDGIETGVRQLIRDEPLETAVVEYHGARITVPTEGEILRIKGVLILKRNATRDYLDFVALADRMGDESVADALQSFDRLYQQESASHSPLPLRDPRGGGAGGEGKAARLSFSGCRRRHESARNPTN